MRTSAENYSPATSYEEALRRAARVWGVQDEYWDILGNRHVADPDIQRSILRSMGFESRFPWKSERSDSATSGPGLEDACSANAGAAAKSQARFP